MAKHRISFWRTVAVSAAATLAFTALMAALLAWDWSRATPAGWPMHLGLWLAILLIMPLAAASALTMAGGVIALRRDSLEAIGKPYAQSVPLEATSTFLISVLRAVFGQHRFGYYPGDIVEIRSLDEIMQTLDHSGTLDGVPFMPEMVNYCGTRARVLRRADKLNDWIHGTGLRRMHRLVLLAGLRCDGSAHGMCQSNCHLRWREEWLRLADHNGSAVKSTKQSPAQQSQLAALSAYASRQTDTGPEVRSVCQATELTAGGAPMLRVDLRHYARDLLTGNVRLRPWLVALAITFFNRVQRMRGAAVFPKCDVGISTVRSGDALGLQPGDLVRVKPKYLIEPTLNSQSKNRGLYFDRDMIRFCGGEYRVKTRIERLIIEKTGQLRLLTNPCIILEGVTATGEYQRFNPENEYIFWREVWLERVAPSNPPVNANLETATGPRDHSHKVLAVKLDQANFD